MIHKLEQFRLDLYEALPYRRDTLFDLLDALSSNRIARSVVELSLSPFFRREYSSITDGIDNFFQATSPEKEAEERQEWGQKLVRLVASYLPQPKKRKFWLFGIDVTPQPRPFAETLADRTYVYQPNTLKGNKPVNIGHQSSVLAYLPEKGEKCPPWIVPLNVRRVSSEETKNEAGAEQVKEMFSTEKLPFSGDLKVLVGDSDYSARTFLGEIYGDQADKEGNKKSDEQVAIVRSAGNRTFYHAPPE
ncbi:MAG: transposase, partial [Planctomycetes bacterium]|nr:transposase [Planctomycetota bacterium]